MRKMLLALLLMGSLAFAIAPVESWTLGGTGKYTQTPAAGYVTEGGNVTNLNLTGNVSTEKWAGYWGNVSGLIVLAPAAGAPLFYSWIWNSGNGGEVCAVAAASGFDWSTVQAVTGPEIDVVWNFLGADTDSADNTLSGACTMNVAGTLVTTSEGVTTNGGAFQTCPVADQAVPAAKTDIAFCVNIAQNGALFNSQTGDYQLLTAANQTLGATETHYFWIELD